MKLTIPIFTILLSFLVGCNQKTTEHRQYLSLEGKWQFSLDTANKGMAQNWFKNLLPDSIDLPGTTDLRKKGFLTTDSSLLHLSRVYSFVGVCWYRKQIDIPNEWADKHISIYLERTKKSMLWIDSSFVSEMKNLQTPHERDLSKYLTPGKHIITLRIDNSLSKTPYGDVHIYSEHSQTNWNGIIGKMYLEATPKTYIADLQIFPNIDSSYFNLKLKIENPANKPNFKLKVYVQKIDSINTSPIETKNFEIDYKKEISIKFPLKDQNCLWDEFEQPLYKITAELENENQNDSKSVISGMKLFSILGTNFTINKKKIFLRGKHEAAVFPITGYTPTDVSEWRRVYKIAKKYGLNHYRFHTYCPPEAAFTAADLEGIYLQVELPFWNNLKTDSVQNDLLNEGKAMLQYYANHPSFVMFSNGNEMWEDIERFEKLTLDFKNYDNRPLYTIGSNLGTGYTRPTKVSDFYVGARTPSTTDADSTHIRLSQSFTDSKKAGILNTSVPSTLVNYDFSVSKHNFPMVSHEIGQYQIYPFYKEIQKYTGVLKPRNLQIFNQRLIKKGMKYKDSVFQQATGKWAAICYKAEMEAALRTNGFAGFQLLDLQDYPGQGTALVGILDAFMDSKNVIQPSEWTQSCNSIVLLLEFSKYCWTNNEIFKSKVYVSNFYTKELNNPLTWELANNEGKILKQGSIPTQNVKIGQKTFIGDINFDLSAFESPQKLNLTVWYQDKTIKNEYPIWIYPTKQDLDFGNTKIVENISNNVLSEIENGKKVLYFPTTKSELKNSLPPLFIPDFWNYGMFFGLSKLFKQPFSPGTLGLLANPKHPLFAYFPTDFHTNWQWFSILNVANPIILDKTPTQYMPILQVIDNLERNHKLGIIFECNIGKGKLLVCSSPLNKLRVYPEANQLYYSILKYMNSNEFNPTTTFEKNDIKKMFLSVN